MFCPKCGTKNILLSNQKSASDSAVTSTQNKPAVSDNIWEDEFGTFSESQPEKSFEIKKEFYNSNYGENPSGVAYYKGNIYFLKDGDILVSKIDFYREDNKAKEFLKNKKEDNKGSFECHYEIFANETGVYTLCTISSDETVYALKRYDYDGNLIVSKQLTDSSGSHRIEYCYMAKDKFYYIKSAEREYDNDQLMVYDATKNTSAAILKRKSGTLTSVFASENYVVFYDKTVSEKYDLPYQWVLYDLNRKKFKVLSIHERQRNNEILFFNMDKEIYWAKKDNKKLYPYHLATSNLSKDFPVWIMNDNFLETQPFYFDGNLFYHSPCYWEFCSYNQSGKKIEWFNMKTNGGHGRCGGFYVIEDKLLIDPDANYYTSIYQAGVYPSYEIGRFFEIN